MQSTRSCGQFERFTVTVRGLQAGGNHCTEATSRSATQTLRVDYNGLVKLQPYDHRHPALTIVMTEEQQRRRQCATFGSCMDSQFETALHANVDDRLTLGALSTGISPMECSRPSWITSREMRCLPPATRSLPRSRAKVRDPKVRGRDLRNRCSRPGCEKQTRDGRQRCGCSHRPGRSLRCRPACSCDR